MPLGQIFIVVNGQNNVNPSGRTAPILDRFCQIVEHCIIGETVFITLSPILGAFYNNEKIILFIVIEQAISQ